MSDRSENNEHEDILTGRGARQARPEPADGTSSRRNQTGPAGEASTAATNRPARSRRRFTVDALFSDTRPQAVGVEDLAEAKDIRLDRIVPDPDQPRRSFDQDRLDELTASITSDGVLQPIVVRYHAGSDRYIIVHGERRYRASQQAGRQSIPALVRDVPEERRLIQQLMENIVRDDLNAIDRARALRMLKSRMNDARWKDVAAEVGIRRSRLFQLLDTSKLPDSTQQQIRAGELSEKQSRTLQGLPQLYQDALASAIMERSVPGAIAQRVSKAIRGSARQTTSSAEAIAHVSELLDLAIAPDDRSRTAQTDQLLQRLEAALGPQNSDSDIPALQEVATALGAPRFSSDRVTKSIGELAQSLARAERPGIGNDPELTHRLQTLRNIIDRLVDT